MRRRFLSTDESTLLTTKEVCKLFGIHETLVYNWRMTRGLPFTTVQSSTLDCIRFDKVTLLVWASGIAMFPIRENKRIKLNQNIA